MHQPLIIIDWGTTNFRAHVLSSNGDILDRFYSSKGVANLDRYGMAQQIAKVHHRWREISPHIIACGMIGSNIGWEEMPYLSCPTHIHRLAQATRVVDIDGISVRLIPGVKYQSKQATWDVMRGEELQAMGWISMQKSRNGTNGLCVMPGTHSKWIHIEQSVIQSFFTAMTGEVFALLRTHGLLRHHLTEPAQADVVFLNGVEAGFTEQGLGRHLFSIRGNCLLGGMTPTEASNYASGLLIGGEIADALRVFRHVNNKKKITIVGAPSLTTLYRTALNYCDVNIVEEVDGQEACVAGFLTLREALDVVQA